MGNSVAQSHGRIITQEKKIMEGLFKNLKRIGTGTYGHVFSGENKTTGQKVAIKRLVFVEREGEEGQETRKRACNTEIAILRHLAGHDNILSIQQHANDFIVLELMQHDLRGLLNSEKHQFFSHPQIKGYLFQALKGLSWIHAKKVIHRDLKPENILVSQGNVVKIADFGMACFYDPDRTKDMPNGVCATWYRAPELFLGCTLYGYEIDIWSFGCIVGELVADTPLLNRHSDDPQVQLDAIWHLLGTPLENGWPEVAQLEEWDKYRPREPVQRNLLDALYSFNKTSRKQWFTKELLDLLDKLLALNPKKRISSTSALEHLYWVTEHPKPQPPDVLPIYGDSYFSGTIKKRK